MSITLSTCLSVRPVSMIELADFQGMRYERYSTRRPPARRTSQLPYLLTYLLTYLLHGAESFLRS